MPLLGSDDFLVALKGLFEQQQQRPANSKGSIYVTQKPAPPKRGAAAAAPPACLYRASDGRAKKFSTLVGAGDAAKFHALLMNTLKVRAARGSRAARRARAGAGFLQHGRRAIGTHSLLTRIYPSLFLFFPHHFPLAACSRCSLR